MRFLIVKFLILVELLPFRKIVGSFLVVGLCSFANVAFGQVDSNYIQKETVRNEVFILADVMPEFPGGEDSLLSFIANNLKYPSCMVCISGTVYAEFEVDSSGNVLNPKILKGLGHGFDKAVLKMIRLMPKWVPAKNNGEPVSCYYTIPVTFE